MECIYNCAAEAAGIDWPAWVQAVGSLVGIAIAIAVPWAQHRLAEKRDRRAASARARAISLAHLEFFREHKLKIDAVESYFHSMGLPRQANDWLNLRSMIDITRIGASLMERSDAFGDAAPQVQNFLYHYVMASVAADNGIRDSSDPDHENAFAEHLMDANSALLAAITVVEKTAAAGAPNRYRTQPAE